MFFNVKKDFKFNTLKCHLQETQDIVEMSVEVACNKSARGINTIPYCNVPNRTVPYRTVPYRTVPYCTVEVKLPALKNKTLILKTGKTTKKSM